MVGRMEDKGMVRDSKVDRISFRVLKSLLVVGSGGGGVESDYSVYPHQLRPSLKGGRGSTQFHQVTKNAFSEMKCSLPSEL